MGSLRSKNWGVKYLCVIDVFTKLAWVKTLADRKAKTLFNGFIGIVNDSKRKANRLWADHGREFHNKLMEKWLDDNDVLMYSTYNEGELMVAERFKIYKKNDS